MVDWMRRAIHNSAFVKGLSSDSQKMNKQLWFLGLFLVLYAVGEYLQLQTWPSYWFRWYFSDITIVGALAWFTVWFFPQIWQSLLFGLGLCLVYEASQFVAGMGDPVDVVCYLVGFAIAITLTKERVAQKTKN